jgi:hypothetical protein
VVNLLFDYISSPITVESAHNHHITGIVWFNRFSHRLDRRGTTRTQGNKQNLISVQVDDIIQATFESYQIHGG